MMKIIALPDLHQRVTHLPQIKHALAEADLILLPGDITNGGPSTSFADMMNEIQHYNGNILAIPGNWERSTDIDYMKAQGIGLHRTHRIIENIAFYGVGGALPFIGYTEFSEAELGAFAREAVQDLPPNLPEIFVCHNPPINTLNDATSATRHVGSHAIRSFIEDRQPLICFTGHVHEGVGIDTIGKTKIINPGPIWQSKSYAYAEMDSFNIHTLEIRQF